MIPRICLIASVLSACPAWAQAARPQFYADSVIPAFGDTPLMLAPAMLVSIYGDNLGPQEGCRGYGDHREYPPQDNPFGSFEPIVSYPTLLCGVQVKIGDAFAGLLWAQDKQINFQVPKDVSFGGSAELRVIRDGAVSDPVTLEFGLERIKLTQDEPAYVGMPVWIRAHTSTDMLGPIRYPIYFSPLRARCEVLEVKWNGVPLPRLKPLNPPRSITVGGGNLCGTGFRGAVARAGELPFHLLYRFDQPGQYEVRLTRLGGDAQTIRERSAWTTIQVRPADPSRRAEWLGAMRAKPPEAAADLLSDYLPSLLGYGDAGSLALLAGYLYHADPSVRGFVERGLMDYYDKAMLVPVLQEALRRMGPSETVTRLLGSLR